jgi:hypothetical protein
MKTLFHLSAVVALFTAFSSSSQAMISVSEVSVERAKEMGIQITSKAAGPYHVRVEMEFRREGSLKSFDPERYDRVEMRVSAGDDSLPAGKRTLMNVPLQLKHPQPGRVSVAFTARRDQVVRISVMIFFRIDLSMSAFDIDLKDFVNLKRLDQPVPAPASAKP